jgi:hypothetical protein
MKKRAKKKAKKRKRSEPFKFVRTPDYNALNRLCRVVDRATENDLGFVRQEAARNWEVQREGEKFRGQFASKKGAARWLLKNQHSNVKFDENETTNVEENEND